MGDTDFEQLYKGYLHRFEKLFGDLEIGDVVRFHQTLIHKLEYCDFVSTWKGWKGLECYLKATTTGGGTILGPELGAYRELCARMLERPIY